MRHGPSKRQTTETISIPNIHRVIFQCTLRHARPGHRRQSLLALLLRRRRHGDAKAHGLATPQEHRQTTTTTTTTSTTTNTTTTTSSTNSYTYPPCLSDAMEMFGYRRYHGTLNYPFMKVSSRKRQIMYEGKVSTTTIFRISPTESDRSKLCDCLQWLFQWCKWV